jgi:hypothetical protein
VLRFLRRFLILSTLATLSCQGPTADVPQPAPKSFVWSDLARPVSFPGPLVESDSAFDQKSLRIIANLAHAEWDSIAAVANDSLFAAVAETPYAARLEGLAQLEAWRTALGEVTYEAFNVRGAYNQGSQSHVAYVFSRWKTSQLNDNDQFIVFTVAWNPQGKLTGIGMFKTGWPRDSVRPIRPTRRPEHFHFYSATRIGSDSAAKKAMDFTEAIYRNVLRPQQALLADTVEYQDGQGVYGIYSRAEVLDLLDHRTKDHQHNLVRYTAIIPWTMLRFGREMAVVVTYEDSQNRDGSTAVYSFCRLYFFDEKGKINNFVFTRRRVHPVGRYPLVD